MPEFDQLETDAFILTFRMFVQDNDRIFIRNLENYDLPWIPTEAKNCLEHARKQVDYFLDDSGTTLMIGERNFAMRELLEITIYGGLAHTKPV